MIRSLNADMSFDQFIREQIAGDEGVDQNIARNPVLSDTIKIISTSLLGLTVGCAQCWSAPQKLVQLIW